MSKNKETHILVNWDVGLIQRFFFVLRNFDYKSFNIAIAYCCTRNDSLQRKEKKLLKLLFLFIKFIAKMFYKIFAIDKGFVFAV